MQHLHVAIQELHELTVDEDDPFKDNRELDENLQGVAKYLSRISAQFPSTKLVLSVNRATRNKRQTTGADNITPSIDHPEKLTCKKTIFGHNGAITSFEIFSRGEKKYLASASVDNTIKLWDLDNQKMVGLMEGHTAPVLNLVALDSEGRTLLAGGSNDGSTTIWNLDDQSLLGRIENNSGCTKALAK
eukprot:3861283-Ditylum_brightwellii.AAC.1